MNLLRDKPRDKLRDKPCPIVGVRKTAHPRRGDEMPHLADEQRPKTVVAMPPCLRWAFEMSIRASDDKTPQIHRAAFVEAAALYRAKNILDFIPNGKRQPMCR